MHWQPIETAPKDGTEILVCDPLTADGKPTTCWGLSIQVAAWWSEEDGGQGDWVVYCSLPSEPRLHFEPTHWCPLPEPPDHQYPDSRSRTHKPLLAVDDEGNVATVDERTLRDHFAIAAMHILETDWETCPPDEIAHRAYSIADAMLKERDR